jgi:predicted phosphodiesterase
MSDLHYERFLEKTTNQYNIPTEVEIPRRAPYIILAGDIGRLCDTHALQNTLRQLCACFEKVLYVPGNHEFYDTSRQEGFHIASTLSEFLGEETFVFMNRTRADLESDQDETIVVLGCTLHSSIPPTSPLTNDFARIQNWTVAEHNSEHLLGLQWLKHNLADIAESRPKTRIIIATHYSPSFTQTAHPRFEHSENRYCFSSDSLEQFADWKGAAMVSHWVFGHTHYNTVLSRGDTIVVSNQPDDGDCLRKFDGEATV